MRPGMLFNRRFLLSLIWIVPLSVGTSYFLVNLSTRYATMGWTIGSFIPPDASRSFGNAKALQIEIRGHWNNRGLYKNRGAFVSSVSFGGTDYDKVTAEQAVFIVETVSADFVSKGLDLQIASEETISTWTRDNPLFPVAILIGGDESEFDWGEIWRIAIASFSIAVIAIVLGLIFRMVLARMGRARSRKWAGLCVNCGYEIGSDAIATCPECGSSVIPLPKVRASLRGYGPK